MIVYRFERNGIGPYTSNAKVTVGSYVRKRTKTRSEKKAESYFVEQLRCASSDNRFEMSRKAHSRNSYLFGCKSKDQLRSYFAGNFKPLFRQGYRIKRYKVPDDEIIDMSVEVAFHVKYHKLQTVTKVKQLSDFY